MIGRTDRFAVHRSGRHSERFVMDSPGGFVQVSLCTMCKIWGNLSSLWVFWQLHSCAGFFPVTCGFWKIRKTSKPSIWMKLATWSAYECGPLISWLGTKKTFLPSWFQWFQWVPSQHDLEFPLQKGHFPLNHNYGRLSRCPLQMISNDHSETLAKRCSGTTAYMSHVTCDNETMQFDSEI